MRTVRLFHPVTLQTDTTIQLSPDAVHHCANVLRLKPGAPLVLFDGSGKEFVCDIVNIEKRRVDVQVDTEISLDPQSPLTIHLAQSISKGDRMEWVLQKATELGVTEITPIVTERCVVKLDPKRWTKKAEQWQKTLIGACEQSGRNTLPVLNDVVSFTSFLSQSTNQSRLILSPKAEFSFNAITHVPTSGLRLLIGPEGGLTDQEIHTATEAGYSAARFGPRVLRTETAAISAISVIQSKFGDLI